MAYYEVNFDGLIGPTHNYAGLAMGNLASASNQGLQSNPRAAALQGLEKMRTLMEMGLPQGFILPLQRPAFPVARQLGFQGSETAIIAALAQDGQGLLANLYSASSMWTANAATVAPSPDTPDGKVHFLPANLVSHFHRSIEAEETARVLRLMFPEGTHFHHHDPLPPSALMGDEGAANHGRLCTDHGSKGCHLFVYGEDGDRFRARQSRHASEAAARLFGLKPEQAIFVKQSRAALDAGAFHNDVVGVANTQVMFLHEQAFEDQPAALSAIRNQFPGLIVIEAPKDQVSLEDAISTYLFNSQLLTLPEEGANTLGDMALVLPRESEEIDSVRIFLEGVKQDDNPIREIIYRDVRESMRNGGGPACLRLRVVLSDAELKAVNSHFLLSHQSIERLQQWVRTHYRDRLAPDDLRDPAFAREALEALDALTQLLEMGSFYDFQQTP